MAFCCPGPKEVDLKKEEEEEEKSSKSPFLRMFKSQRGKMRSSESAERQREREDREDGEGGEAGRERELERVNERLAELSTTAAFYMWDTNPQRSGGALEEGAA